MYLFSAVLVLVFETSTPELLMSKKIIFFIFSDSEFRIPSGKLEVFEKKYFFNFRIPNSEFPHKIDFQKKLFFLFFFRIPNSGFPLEIEVFKKNIFFNFRIPNSEFPLKIDFQKKLFFVFSDSEFWIPSQNRINLNAG